MSDGEPQEIPTLRPFGVKGRTRKQRTPADRRQLIASQLPGLMLVTNWSKLRGRTHHEVVSTAVDAGVNMVQMRDRLPVHGENVVIPEPDLRGVPTEMLPVAREVVEASSGGMLQMASTLGALAIAKDALVLVHSGGGALAAGIVESFDDLDQGTVGLHVPDRPLTGIGVPPGARQERRLLAEGIIISRSVHSLEAALQAERDGADMLVLGTIFPSSSHPGGPTIGLEGVRAVCDAVSIPVIGIGGITAANAGDVIRAGASGVAVISAIFDADDPRAAAAELRAAIDAAWAEKHPSQ